jgi:hypothetical protein
MKPGFTSFVRSIAPSTSSLACLVVRPPDGTRLRDPFPQNARCVRLGEVLAARELYDCIIVHNLRDLLVIHSTLGGMILDQHTVTSPDELRRAVSQYVRMIGAHVMAVSRLKGRSWGLDEDVVLLSADPARGLRVANQIRRKTRTLKWDFHERALGGMPLTLIGRNNDLPGVGPSRDWNDLKQIFRRHRFFIHPADPALEDGYNITTPEATAGGLPVLGNCHPTSPVRNEINGFLSDDPVELRVFAWRLLKDREPAAKLGCEARKTVAELFSAEKFKSDFARSIETARVKWFDFVSHTFASRVGMEEW